MYPFHVTYYYLATGMDGYPDTRDYGVHWADTAKEAIDEAIFHNHTRDYGDVEWLRSCLKARKLA